jgi:hypothetical protein
MVSTLLEEPTHALHSSMSVYQYRLHSGSDCVRFLLHTCKPMTYTMAHRLQESGDDAAAARTLSMEARRVAAMYAAMDIVSSGPLEARGAQGTASWSE